MLRATIDRRVTVMIAEAERKARETRGQGDAQAAKIYAETYRKIRSCSHSCVVWMLTKTASIVVRISWS